MKVMYIVFLYCIHMSRRATVSDRETDNMLAPDIE